MHICMEVREELRSPFATCSYQCNPEAQNSVTSFHMQSCSSLHTTDLANSLDSTVLFIHLEYEYSVEYIF